MIRLVLIAFLLALMVRVVAGRWPWDYARISTRDQRVHEARKLLGVSADAPDAEIRAAHRRKVAALHPDRGGSTAAAQELNAARDLLLAQDPSATEPD